ncbi:MAG: hypothetical protein JWQ07_5436, partial [Ramlibacter sp.]|nr:hypothetical protein [Ramlibacter sp.]
RTSAASRFIGCENGGRHGRGYRTSTSIFGKGSRDGTFRGPSEKDARMRLCDIEIEDRYVTVVGEQPTASGVAKKVVSIEVRGLAGWVFGWTERRRYEEAKTQLLGAVLHGSKSPILCWEDDPGEAKPIGRWRQVGPVAWQMRELPDVQALRRRLAPGWWHLYATDSGEPIDPADLAVVWDAPPPWQRLRDQGLRMLVSAHADDDPWLAWLPRECSEGA